VDLPQQWQTKCQQEIEKSHRKCQSG
jgi:hypothetical protein